MVLISHRKLISPEQDHRRTGIARALVDAAIAGLQPGAEVLVTVPNMPGGPYPLGYNGLGDVFVFLFFGLIAVAGTTYVQALVWMRP
mgnify:CR=1 FL=1